jgi:NTE family protein
MAAPRVAIACQGGGSHTAFTAGALSTLLRPPRDAEVVGLSGTSGGAVCALLAWNGLVAGRRDPTDRLRAFWREVAASDPLDWLVNEAIVGTLRFWGHWVSPETSPYELPLALVPNRLPELLERYAEPDQLAARVGDPAHPLLLISAVNVLSGDLVTFRGGGPLPRSAANWRPVTLEAVVASSAVPNLSRAVVIDGEPYWDGLYAQNPPLRELLDTEPDELWIIQINPATTAELPKRPSAIRDRRNELSGNLSLQQEIYFIEKVNELIATGMLSEAGLRKYRHVEVRTLEMSPRLSAGLDYESEGDRRPELLRELAADGRRQAEAFLRGREAPTRLGPPPR